jgi:hypothetical protein
MLWLIFFLKKKDFSAFDVNKYVNNMLVDKHLSELMQRYNDLSTGENFIL